MTHPTYPPKNRRSTSLPILRIEIEHSEGIEVFDPNGILMALVREPARLFGLAPLPSRASDLSLEPAVLYRADDLEVALSPEELIRLAAHNLAPVEYKALRDRFGMAHEWHEDFYDPDTGEALQPLEVVIFVPNGP